MYPQNIFNAPTQCQLLRGFIEMEKNILSSFSKIIESV